jgi:hypothetical protein
MTDASVPQIGRYYSKTRSAAIARSIAKLEEQRCKKSVVDLVIRELVEQAELRLACERRRLNDNQRRPMYFADNRLMRTIHDCLANPK